ncbi:SPOR domain-containing protein [Leptothermofonsia sp. ETS-13]|uniref:SPOR domain-containing protein n=1 Tax=Leptothermofonsia sp. ETS-13 TaxID=3035696 RepID=UPI003B9FE3D6
MPIGNAGSRSGIKIFSQTNQEDGSVPPVPPNLAGLLGIRYRVVVEADDSQREQIQAVVPDAFPTFFKGRRVFQVGAFSDRAKADQLVQTLITQGLRATVEVIE